MIELFFFPSPNGLKVLIFLEEAGLDYRITPVDIAAGDQFAPSFLLISPNNKIPAIRDHAAAGSALDVFESGSILEYLAEKTGRFLPVGTARRYMVKQWLYWQVASLGPMAGQAHHFRAFAPQRVPYAIERYTDEMNRLYGVLNTRLAGRRFVADEYSIADMAIWPWIANYERQGQDLDDFLAVREWFERLQARPAIARAAALGQERLLTPDEYEVLLNQTSKTADRFKH